ncbi:hypothetical protein FSP39_008524 [Pinctada imbricata]|uniref:Uncharacterized protein n=1 Tax=Pinctada imbricata TaxID=66713 RepID=A0AA88YL84_PINIB|nr:hypothetical protein FSP39_008524 [Pinctada imbricata]
MKNLSYEERLRKLKLPTLKYRRNRGDMIEVYKIISKKYDSEASNFIMLRKDHTERETNRGNTKKLLVQRPRLNIRKYSFSVRVTHLWNSLPESVVSAKTLNTFKNRLDKFWQHQDIVYDYTAEFRIDTGSHSYNNSLYNNLSESSEEDQ